MEEVGHKYEKTSLQNFLHGHFILYMITPTMMPIMWAVMCDVMVTCRQFDIMKDKL